MKIAVVAPVFNDWESFFILLRSIDAQVSALGGEVDIFAVDDGSTMPFQPGTALKSLQNIGEISVVELACNLGHQRAIAAGLVHVWQLARYDLVIIMDSDGEDQPEEFPKLIEQHRAAPESIIVCQRSQRSEGAFFVFFYVIYKWLFRQLTGRRIDFGNYSLVPGKHVARLVHMPELWNHIAAAILRSRIPVQRLETSRGQRYAGRSSMSFFSLIIHGLSAVAVFSDFLFVRLLVLSLWISVVAGGLIAIAIVLRLFTNLAIPGWTTTVVGIALIVVLQGLTLSVTAAFLTLSNRAGLPFVPAVHGLSFIQGVRRIKPDAE